eukprot:8731872-Prorocentrum_lima.AAC.1
MTSSLVGSEMCIRDRQTHWYPEGGRLDGAPVVDAASCMVPRNPVLVPVSYTHLTLPTICSV